ncbi:MAG: GNAT family N-acetyltransferase [Acholeplasmataceae bacterium]|jgi:ribosomal protein S18 acetylase RimI-like enzyme|nr:GNAT family N-acetyltransferase [Acholeplasmataceae bacterium]
MIRLARQSDIDKIWQLRLQTTELLKERQIDQWQYIDPSIETFKKDIEQNEFFVYEVLGEIFGMIAIKFGVEPTYLNIYDGQWHVDQPYLTIHRLAVKRDLLGSKIAQSLLIFAEEHAKNHGINYIRIDTHEKNRYAIRLFTSFNYQLCGYIVLVQKQGDLKRLAYDKQL